MCGIAGAYGLSDAAVRVVAMAEGRLQHRGQEAAGCVSTDGTVLYEHKGLGLVERVFRDVDIRAKLPGSAAIVHLRYSTTGASQETTNVQPFVVEMLGRGLAASSHNGNLTNYRLLRGRLESEGAVLKSSSDSEVFLPLAAGYKDGDMLGALTRAAILVDGSFSLLVLTPQALYAMRDPFGIRPLFMAPCGEGWLVASETCALDMFRSGPCEEVAPGTIVEFGPRGRIVSSYAHAEERRDCAFELAYFMRPDSTWGDSADAVRKRMGALLSGKRSAPVDFVSPVPDSANSIALGFSQASGVPLEFSVLRNHYFQGRTFILPDQLARERAVDMKFGIVPELIRGKSIALTDDSIVRGNTLKKLVRLLRAHEVKEVHLFIGYPAIIHPCHWGIDMQTMDELIATRLSTAEMIAHFDVDSLEFLSVAEYQTVIGDPDGKKHCFACITRKHPTDGVPLIQIGRPTPIIA